MARLWTAGAEVEAGISPSSPDGSRDSGGDPTIRSAAKARTGAASWLCDSLTGPNFMAKEFPVTWAASVTYSFRAYLLFSHLPAGTTRIMQLGSSIAGLSVRLTSAGKVQLFNDAAGTQIGSDSSETISADGTTWHRFEIQVTMNGSTQFASGELRLNGTSVATFSGLTLTAGNAVRAGWCSGGTVGTDLGTNKQVYVDDVALNDSTGADNTSWPGDGAVVLMLPISDNNRGAWVAGAGGTTNLFEGVNNTPPVGVADASATNGSQIKNKSTTNPTSCDLNLDTYTNAGVTGTVNVIRVIAVTGEDPATGTKAGTIEMVSNPAIGPSASFDYGNNAGAQSTYLGLWFWVAVQTEAPTPTLGTAPVIRITCTSGATAARAASCGLLGAYVDYTPDAGGNTYTKAGYGKESG